MSGDQLGWFRNGSSRLPQRETARFQLADPSTCPGVYQPNSRFFYLKKIRSGVTFSQKTYYHRWPGLLRWCMSKLRVFLCIFCDAVCFSFYYSFYFWTAFFSGVDYALIGVVITKLGMRFFFIILFLHFWTCCDIRLAHVIVCLLACLFAFCYHICICVLALFFAVVLCFA